MERVKILANAGSTSQRHISIEKWVDSIILEGDPDCAASSDGAMTYNEDDLLLGAEAKIMTAGNPADDETRNISDKISKSVEISQLAPVKQNFPSDEIRPVTMEQMTNPAHDQVMADLRDHVTSDDEDHVTEKMAADSELETSCERELSWRTKLAVMGLIHMDSIQSQSEINNKTYTCVDDILQDRSEDPEEILTNLGFAGQPEMASPLFRVPVRFLKEPTRASGIDVKTFLENNPDFQEYLTTKGVVLDKQCKTDEAIKQTSRSFHKIARKVSTIKKATDMMRPSVMLFPGFSCTKSSVDGCITWKVEPIQYIAPSGTRYNSILHPHNAQFRARQGLYEYKPLPPDVAAKLRWQKSRKLWYSSKQQAVGGFEGIDAETAEEGAFTPDILTESSKIMQHNAEQKRRIFRDAKGSPLPYPIYRNSPQTSPTALLNDVCTSGKPAENTIEITSQLQASSERHVPNQADVRDRSVMLTVPVVDWNKRPSPALSCDLSAQFFNMDAASRNRNASPRDVRTVFSENSYCILTNSDGLGTDEEAACDNEIRAINCRFCDGAGHYNNNENAYRTNNYTSTEGDSHPLVHCTSVDSAKSEVLQSFDLEEIQSSDVNGNDVLQQHQQQQHPQQQQQRHDSFRNMTSRDSYTHGSSFQSDSSGFVEFIDQPELSYDLHKKICLGHVHIESPVPEASSLESEETQNIRASVSRLKEMDTNPEFSAIPVVQMVEKQPNHGFERFTLDEFSTSNHTSSWRTDPEEHRMEQLIDLDIQEDKVPIHGSKHVKKEYPKEKDPWRNDVAMDESRKLALSEFGNFLSANSDVTLCESDDNSSPVTEIVDSVTEPDSGHPRVTSDKFSDPADHKEAIEELGSLLARTMLTSDSVSAETSGNSGDECGSAVVNVMVERELEPSGQNSELNSAKQMTEDHPPGQVTVEFVVESPPSADATVKTKVSESVTSSSDSEREQGLKKVAKMKEDDQKSSDSDESSAEEKGHSFFRKFKKNKKKKKKTKVLDQLAKSTLTGCRVKNTENDLKTSEADNVQMSSGIISQLAEVTASTGLKVTNVDPGANKLIRDDPVQDGGRVTLTASTEEVESSKQDALRHCDSHEPDSGADYDVKRPSFLAADYDTMHQLVEKEHRAHSSDEESDLYDDATPTLEQSDSNRTELREASDDSMKTALSELHPGDMPTAVASRHHDEIDINVPETRASLSSSSSSASSDDDKDPEGSGRTKQTDRVPSPQLVEVNINVAEPVRDSCLDTPSPGSPTEPSPSVWDKSLTSSDIEYLDNLAIELAVPRCVSHSRAQEEVKRNASQQSVNRLTSEPPMSSDQSEDETASGRQADKSEPGPLSRFMKKLQPKTRSEKHHKAALKKSETIANTDDLRKRHDKGVRVSKPALLRRRRKNRSKSEPGSIDVEHLEKLSPGLKKKSDSKGFSQWFKNILHTPKSKNAKEVQQTSPASEAARTKDHARDQKTQHKGKGGSGNIHDAITQLALSTMPINPEVQNAQVNVNYTSADSESSSKWGVSDSDEEDVQPKVPSGDEVQKAPQAQSAATVLTCHKPEQSSSSDQSLNLVRNERLRSSVKSTVSELHINLKKTESLEKTHKSEVMLIVVNGEVKDVKKCDAESSDAGSRTKVQAKQCSESTTSDNVFVDSLSLSSGSLSSSSARPRQITSFHVDVKPPDSDITALVSDTVPRQQAAQQLADLQQQQGTVTMTRPSVNYLCPLSAGQDGPSPCSLQSGVMPVSWSSPDVCCHRSKGTSGTGETSGQRETCQHQILCHLLKYPGICDLPKIGQFKDLPVWPDTTSQNQKQHLLNEVQLLQKALNKYKLEFRSLELRSSALYLSLSDVLSAEDRLAADSLRELQHDINKEIVLMEQNLSACHTSILTQDSSKEHMLSVNLASLYIIQEMIELLKEQIYRSSIISVTKQCADHSTAELENEPDVQKCTPLVEQYSGELMPQMVLLQKQLETQQLLLVRVLSRQLEELQDNVLQEIRHSIQKQTQHQSPMECAPGLRGYKDISQSSVTTSPNESRPSCRDGIRYSQCSADSLDVEEESNFVISVSPDTRHSDQQISVSNALNLRDELNDASKSYQDGSSVTHNSETTAASRWEQRDSGFKEGEELFV